MTNWRTAYDLLASDPDLRGIDFYLLCAVKDLEVVESSRRLACFLHLTRRAYGPKARITLLGHSAGGLVARHCSVSTFFVPGSLDDFLMIASPNQGGAGSIALFGLLGLGREDYTGLKSALPFASRWDDLLGCLNNREPTVDCSGRFFIDKRLQDNRGLNPNVPCAILAGEVRDQVINQSEDLRNDLGGIVEDLFGQEAGTMAREVMRNVDKGLLERMPEGDLLFSLESQLIPGVPYKVLPYQHGTIHQPHSRNDIRYRAMKHFILNGSLVGSSL